MTDDLLFAEGTILIDAGQQYRCDRIEPYQRKDGTMTTLAVWVSHCADCGDPFEYKTPRKAHKPKFNRRCQLHKAPLKPVVVPQVPHRSRTGPADDPATLTGEARGAGGEGDVVYTPSPVPHRRVRPPSLRRRSIPHQYEGDNSAKPEGPDPHKPPLQGHAESPRQSER